MKLRPLVLALFFALCLALSFSSAPAPAATTRISKLLVVVEENHGLAAAGPSPPVAGARSTPSR
jgi:hypothetical protein